MSQELARHTIYSFVSVSLTYFSSFSLNKMDDHYDVPLRMLTWFSHGLEKRFTDILVPYNSYLKQYY